MKQLIAMMMLIFVLSGCAVGFMTSYSQNPKTGHETKIVYSPLFSSDSTSLAKGAEFRVSVVITRRVEPVSYSLLSSIGGLTLEDTESAATAVVHFKNDSNKLYEIDLKKITLLNKEFHIKIPRIGLRPSDRFDTKSIAIKAPTYDTKFDLRLSYELDGKPFVQNFFMSRQTMEELKAKARKK